MVLRQEHSKQIWDLLILKILESRKSVEVLEIARELAVLDDALRETLQSHRIEDGLFGAGFVEIPSKGVWRITDQGRKYLRSIKKDVRSIEPNIALSGDVSTPDE